ncbi:hypothetical protein ACH5RR_023851 [Cinchona calisaya]|uniref:Uncharacterized protein n=1 Tax=Cinchona calisaya TaxID=153742 RepID=A0ABD2ZCX4_9GENT
MGHVETGNYFSENVSSQTEMLQPGDQKLFTDENLAEILDSISKELDPSSKFRTNQKQPSSSVLLPSNGSSPTEGPVPKEGSCFIHFTTPDMSGSDTVHHALINKRLVNEGKRRKIDKKGLSRLEKIPKKPLVLLVIPSMPYDLLRLYTGLSKESLDFKKKPSAEDPSGIQLYFYDTEEELSRRLDSSPKLRESTVKLLMNVLGQNAYAKFFKGHRDIPNIEDQTIILNSYPGLYQPLYNLPSTSQVLQYGLNLMIKMLIRVLTFRFILIQIPAIGLSTTLDVMTL